jgi:rhamnose utilization protein RhaD (predicted bifunctional aldolase and dehydrogenase)
MPEVSYRHLIPSIQVAATNIFSKNQSREKETIKQQGKAIRADMEIALRVSAKERTSHACNFKTCQQCSGTKERHEACE